MCHRCSLRHSPRCRVTVARSIVLGLVNVCSANQDTIRSLVDEVRALRLEVSRSRPPPPLTSHRGPPPPPVSTRFCPPLPADSRPPACGRLPPLPCRRAGCENPSHLDCNFGFCDVQCANTRCRSALPPRRGRREPRQPPLPSNDTPSVVTPSHRPVESPPSTTVPNTCHRSGCSETNS